MERYRVFAGIPLPPAYQQGLSELNARLRWHSPSALKCTKPGNWHLTLKFLGDVPVSGEGGLPGVQSALAGVAWERFAMAGAGGGFFPNASRPRVLWVGIDPGGPACVALAAGIEAALAPLGYAPERRPFSPHLTLARVKEPGRGGDFSRVLKLMAEQSWPVITVDAFILWRSILGPNGPRYEVLATFAARG